MQVFCSVAEELLKVLVFYSVGGVDTASERKSSKPFQPFSPMSLQTVTVSLL